MIGVDYLEFINFIRISKIETTLLKETKYYKYLLFMAKKI